MGTEVLRSHDCLIERIRLPQATVYPRRRSGYNGRSKAAPVRSDQKTKASESSPPPMISKQITILKRGEKLDLKQRTKVNSGNDLIVSGTERLGPDPVMVTKQVRFKDPKTEVRSRSLSPKTVLYAGSAFSVSPAPESLPLPSFSKKKQVSMTVDDSATRDLRRLLRLD